MTRRNTVVSYRSIRVGLDKNFGLGGGVLLSFISNYIIYAICKITSLELIYMENKVRTHKKHPFEHFVVHQNSTLLIVSYASQITF